MKKFAESDFKRIRRPAVAGLFYPADEAALRRSVRDCLDAAKPDPAVSPKAVIAPHAGYVYSGPIAGSAFVHFLSQRKEIRRIILVGPSHRIPFNGIAVSGAEAFQTPLGLVPLDPSAQESIKRLPQVRVSDQAHSAEHSLEVELPFLQETIEDFTLVPLVVGDATAEEVSEVLDRLWGGAETRIVVSSDLSHYLDYDTARRSDRAAAQAIENLEPQELEADQACGCQPVRGLLHAARQRGLKARTVDLRNSGDTAGSKDRVVGYGAFIFSDLI
jgi:AmmeMemoRadiSam system protein B